MLYIQNLYKSYHSSEGEQIVFEDASAEIPTDRIVALMGVSGSGKSTLLNIIATIDKADKGEIIYPFANFKLSQLKNTDTFRSEHIGFVFQSHNLLPEFTIYENIVLPAIIAKKERSHYDKRVHLLMEKCGIIHLASKRPTQVSGGEAQRAAIARALINSPDLVLADEPTGNLDEDNSQNVIELLLDICEKENTGAIIATHSIDIATKCSQIYKVDHKKISPTSTR